MLKEFLIHKIFTVFYAQQCRTILQNNNKTHDSEFHVVKSHVS